MTTPKRSLVRLGLRCNNRCVFCGIDGLTGDLENVSDALAAARRTSDAVTFVGGEPTLDDRLPRYVAEARSLGFERVGVQTNGCRTADGAFTRTLTNAGMTDLQLTLLGGEPRVHEYHTGRPGSFGEVLATMTVADSTGLTTLVATVVTRSNFRVLGAIPPLLAARKVRRWLLTIPHVAGRAAVEADRVVPRLGLALPFALHALSAGKALGLDAWIDGAPLCLLGPFAARATAAEPRAYGDACSACPVRSDCPGIDAAYLVRFDGDELVARASIPPRDESDAPSLFAGAGELAKGATPARASSANGRRSLPMLGKVKPAVAEALRGAERKTGDALKEILPALFEETKSG